MEKELKVLILEDIVEDMDLIMRVLRKSGLRFQAKRVDTKDHFVKALTDFNPDVILSDHSLPQFNSVEALSIWRSSGLQIPFILVTGAVSEEFAVNILKQGADNYVLKSNLTRLPSAIVSALKQKETELAKQKTSEALKSQNQELTKINKELDSFVYSVSHNLKAPLMSLLGLLQLAKMEDDKIGNTFKEYFSMMEKSIYKLDETLKEILDYSRNARKELTVERVNIRKLIDENLEKLQYMPGADRLEKRIYVDEPCPFYSDAYRLSVIFNNLISNAIKYADSTKPNSYLDITVEVTQDKAVIKIEDNGIGIDEAYINKVFDMFFRATMQKEGAGLGLYIVKETLEKLSGHIEIMSKPKQGTRFTIEVANHRASEQPIDETVDVRLMQ